ncbi:ribosomal RNA small subunit methyltransferase A [Candidatus Parcubacteria bacterium]|nr:ribosomal RNA small subunit methyltransferase A [Candidatus Parcubacteria bacterium]
MNLLQQTKQLCKLYNIKPARTKGQNFLIKEEVYDKIVQAADLKKDDVVLEVGPGLGFLTVKLAKKVKKVIAVELDDKLAEVLRNSVSKLAAANLETEFLVMNEDILKFKISKFKIQNYKIVANLPYNITSIFLRKFLSDEVKPKLMVLMLQKEVAERIVAKPGKMSLLAVSVQFYAKPEIIEIVPADNFWPKPAVDSAIIKLSIKPPSGLRATGWLRDFFRLVKIGFSAKRKMLKNNLANGYHISQQEAEDKLKKADFDIKIRAQELSVEDWARLFEEFRRSVL